MEWLLIAFDIPFQTFQFYQSIIELLNFNLILDFINTVDF